jgi:acyl dehydratase
MSVRFTAPVFPGETIRTEMWNSDGGLSFRSRALERDTMVLGSGWVEFND